MAEKVLVLGGDVNAFLAVVRSLGRRGLEVHVADAEFTSAALRSRYISAVHALPLHAASPGNWTRALRKIIENNRISMVLPTSDSSLTNLHHDGRWPGGPLLATPGHRAFEIFTDKLATRRLARNCGVPVASAEVPARATDLRLLASRLGFPMVLKPRTSYVIGDIEQKRCAQIIDGPAELSRAAGSPEAANCFLEAFFDGDGVGVSILARSGDIVRAYQHRRLAAAWDTGPSTSRITERVDPALLRHVTEMAKATELTGVAMFEFRVDRRTGDHVLLEVNPRFWGSLPLALDAGADFPAELYDLLTGGSAPRSPDYRVGRIKRDMLGEYCRIVRAAEEGKVVSASLSAIAAAFRVFSSSRWDSWSADDPEPFREERRELRRRLGTAVAKRIASSAPAGFQRRPI